MCNCAFVGDGGVGGMNFIGIVIPVLGEELNLDKSECQEEADGNKDCPESPVAMDFIVGIVVTVKKAELGCH